MRVWVCHWRVCRSQRKTRNVLLLHFLPSSFYKGFCTEPETSKCHQSSCLLPHSVGVTGPDAYAATVSFLGSCWRFELRSSCLYSKNSCPLSYIHSPDLELLILLPVPLQGSLQTKVALHQLN